MKRKFGEVNYYLKQLLSGHCYFSKQLFKMGNYIYDDTSIDSVEHTFFHCRRMRLEKRNLAVKTGACSIENICDVILNSEGNLNSMASYTKPLLKSKKFDFDKRIRMEV